MDNMIKIIALAAGNAVMIALLVLFKGGGIGLGAMAALAVVVGSMFGFTFIQVAEAYGPAMPEK